MASRRTWCLYLFMWVCCGLVCCDQVNEFNQSIPIEKPSVDVTSDIEWTRPDITDERIPTENANVPVMFDVELKQPNITDESIPTENQNVSVIPDDKWTQANITNGSKSPIETPNMMVASDVEWTQPNITDEKSEDFINYMVHLSYGCPVNHTLPCVPKCCNVSEGLSEAGCMATYSDKFFPQFSDCPDDGSPNLPAELRYEYFIGDPCVDGKYQLDKDKYPDDDYLLYSNGSLYYTKQMLSMADYCMDVVNDSVRVFVCFESGSEAPVKFQHILYPVGLLLSLPFLIATAVTYTFIEKFRDLQGKCLTCHVLSMAAAYLFLAIVQLAGRDLSQNMCIATAFLIQFFFVASFCWLNVLSFYTYKNIHDMNRYSQLGIKNERRMFIMYSLYSWYMPGILLIVSMVMDLQPDIPDSVIKPQFGVRSCWFNSDTAALPYFYGPVGGLVLINLVFFAMSAYRIFKEKRQAVGDKNRGNVVGRVKKYIRLFKDCLLLFIIMGINWLMEIISWAVGGPDLIWLMTDVLNTLQGLLIFYIFVIRPLKVRKAVFKHLRRFWGKIRHCDIKYKEPASATVNFLPRGGGAGDDEEDENIRNDVSS